MIRSPVWFATFGGVQPSLLRWHRSGYRESVQDASMGDRWGSHPWHLMICFTFTLWFFRVTPGVLIVLSGVAVVPFVPSTFSDIWSRCQSYPSIIFHRQLWMKMQNGSARTSGQIWITRLAFHGVVLGWKFHDFRPQSWGFHFKLRDGSRKTVPRPLDAKGVGGVGVLSWCIAETWNIAKCLNFTWALRKSLSSVTILTVICFLVRVALNMIQHT